MKGFTIGEKRETRVTTTAGPGAYSPERADSITRTKTANINMGTSAVGTRLELETNTQTADLGPGQYEDRSYQIGKDTKSFTIGEKRYERVAETTMGPGDYDIDRADMQVRSKVVGIRMDSSPGRQQTFGVDSNTNLGPGQYQESREFG